MNDFAFEQGAALPNWPTKVTQARQRRYHAAAEIPADLFAGRVDPSVLANDTIHALSFTRNDDRQGLHAGQNLRLFEPIDFDEPLTLVGHVATVRQISKGKLTVTAFDYTRPDGSVPLRMEQISLQPDYDGMASKGGGGSTGLTAEGYDTVMQCDLTPEKVADYSFEFPTYYVHFRPEAAQVLGLRAPIAQGAMSLTWMLAALAQDGPFDSLAFESSFRQPIYWNDHVDVLRRGEVDFAVANGKGEICSLGRLTEIARS